MTVRNRSLVVMVVAVLETARLFRRRVRFDIDFVVVSVANNLGLPPVKATPERTMQSCCTKDECRREGIILRTYAVLLLNGIALHWNVSHGTVLK
jgi:hypothetical protein